MLQADIIGCVRSTDFETGEDTAQLRLRLPGGDILTVPVSPAYLQKIMERAEPAAGGSLQVQAGTGAYREASPFHEEPVEESPEPQEAGAAGMEDAEVNWLRMPEAVLPHDVKIAMLDNGLPDILPFRYVLEVRDSIITEYTQEQWHELARKYAPQTDPTPAAVPPPAPAPRETPGVSRYQGSVVRPSVPSRTVPKDDHGYPVVAQHRSQPVDPGEVSLLDDGDGVGNF